MIDVRNEKLIRLADVPLLPWIPEQPGGRITAQAIHGWTTRGVKGIRLEKVEFGGVRCTSEAALIRFFERIASGNPNAQPTPTAAELRNVDDSARKTLAALGIL